MRTWILEKGPLFRRRALLVLVAALPVFILRMVNDPINVPKLTLLGVVLTLVAVVRVLEITQGASAEGLKRLLVPVAALLLPLAIAWAASPYREWAVFGSYRRFDGLLPYIVVAVLGVLVADAFAGRTRELAWAAVTGGALVGLYALVQFAGLDPLEWALFQGEDRPSGTLGNPNFLGGYLGIMSALLAALWIVERKRRVWVVTAGIALVGGLIVSFSQGGWAAAVAGVAVVAGTSLQPRWSRARAAGLIVALAIGVLAVGQVLLGIADPENPLVPGTVRLRSDAWQGATAMVLDHPIVGRGPNAFAVEGAHHRTLRDAHRIGYNYPDDPHSVLLAFATAAGILGVIGFLLAFGWLLRQGLKGPADDVLHAGFLGGLVAYLVQAAVSIDTVSLRAALWIVAGGLVASQLPRVADRAPARRRRKKKESLSRVPLVAITVVFGAASILWTLGFLWADAQVWSGTTHAVNRRPYEARAAYRRAIAFRADHDYRRLYGLVMGRVAAGSGDRGFFEEAREAFSYVNNFPQVSRLAEYARFLDSWGDIDPEGDEMALDVFERMTRLDPLNPEIPVEKAAVLIDLGRGEEALAELEGVRAWAERVGDRAPRRTADFWGALALGLAGTGDDTGAQAAADRALAQDEDQEDALQALALLEEKVD